MAIALAQAAVINNPGSVSSSNTVYGSAVGAGSLLVLIGRYSTGGLTPTVSDNVNAGNWTLAGEFVQTNDANGTIQIYYKANSGAGTPTVTYNLGTARVQRVIILEFSGAATSSPLDGSTVGAENTGITPASGNITPANNGSVFVCGAFANSAVTFLAGTDYTISGEVPAAPNTRLGGEYFVQPTAASHNGTFTLGGSVSWGAIAAVFKPAAAAAPVPKLLLLGVGMVFAPAIWRWNRMKSMLRQQHWFKLYDRKGVMSMWNRMSQCLVALLCAAPVYAQAATVAIFDPAAVNPNTATPIAPPVIYTMPLCGQPFVAEATPPIINPTLGEYTDPANSTQDCTIDIHPQLVTLPDGAEYLAAMKLGTGLYGPLSTPFALQVTHPCDGVPATSATVAGGTRTFSWCFSGLDTNGNVTTVTSWALYTGAVRSVLTGVIVGATANAIGLKLYTAFIVVPNGSTLPLQVAAVNVVGEAAKSPVFTVQVVAPVSVPATSIIRNVN